jgi:hypothetical protein
VASANAELVQSICAGWERGDFSSAEWAHPEIEYVWADGPTPGTGRGLAGMAEGEREFLSVLDEFSAEVEEYRELDGERVLVLLHVSGRGKASGIEVEQIWLRGGASLFQVRGGKVRSSSTTSIASARSPTSGSLRRPVLGVL